MTSRTLGTRQSDVPLLAHRSLVPGQAGWPRVPLGPRLPGQPLDAGAPVLPGLASVPGRSRHPRLAVQPILAIHTRRARVSLPARWSLISWQPGYPLLARLPRQTRRPLYAGWAQLASHPCVSLLPLQPWLAHVPHPALLALQTRGTLQTILPSGPPGAQVSSRTHLPLGARVARHAGCPIQSGRSGRSWHLLPLDHGARRARWTHGTGSAQLAINTRWSGGSRVPLGAAQSVHTILAGQPLLPLLPGSAPLSLLSVLTRNARVTRCTLGTWVSRGSNDL